MQEKSESSETEEKITKVREAPWIHPEAVADMIRSNEAEERDRPALIRLYIRAQMNFFGKPGKSGKSKDYWPDNQTIAECLGVPEYDVQNALRYSDIERIGGGKGRGQGKRFRIVKKEWNHGGMKIGRIKSNQRDQSDSENVESTSAPRNIDVCQQSNQRLQHVESTSATALEGDGLEKRGVEGEGGGSLRAYAREPNTPPPLVPQVSFKKLTAEESKEYLNDFDLIDSDSLPLAYYGLIAEVCGASLHDGSGDADKAALLLKGIPAEFRRQDVIASWMIWYVFQLSPKWNGDTHYLTRFSASWATYSDMAKETQKAINAQKKAQAQREADEKAKVATQYFISEVSKSAKAKKVMDAVIEMYGYEAMDDNLGILHGIACDELGIDATSKMKDIEVDEMIAKIKEVGSEDVHFAIGRCQVEFHKRRKEEMARGQNVGKC